MPKIIQDLLNIGWERFTSDNKKVFYVRPGPDRRKVNQRRDLTATEKTEIGDILFPGRKKGKLPETPSVPTPSTSGGSRPSDIFEFDSSEEQLNEVPGA